MKKTVLFAVSNRNIRTGRFSSQTGENAGRDTEWSEKKKSRTFFLCRYTFVKSTAKYTKVSLGSMICACVAPKRKHTHAFVHSVEGLLAALRRRAIFPVCDQNDTRSRNLWVVRKLCEFYFVYITWSVGIIERWTTSMWTDAGMCVCERVAPTHTHTHAVHRKAPSKPITNNAHRVVNREQGKRSWQREKERERVRKKTFAHYLQTSRAPQIFVECGLLTNANRRKIQ